MKNSWRTNWKITIENKPICLNKKITIYPIHLFPFILSMTMDLLHCYIGRKNPISNTSSRSFHSQDPSDKIPHLSHSPFPFYFINDYGFHDIVISVEKSDFKHTVKVIPAPGSINSLQSSVLSEFHISTLQKIKFYRMFSWFSMPLPLNLFLKDTLYKPLVFPLKLNQWRQEKKCWHKLQLINYWQRCWYFIPQE